MVDNVQSQSYWDKRHVKHVLGLNLKMNVTHKPNKEFYQLLVRPLKLV